MKHDVVIIGAGLSGLIAAKTAAENGLRTLVLAKGMGMIHTFWGGIDLLGYHPKQTNTVVEDLRAGLERLIQDQPTHPYAKAGLETIEKSMDVFSDLFGKGGYHYVRDPWRNALLPTGLGSLRPAYMVPSTMSEGRTILSEGALLVGFQEFGNFYPAYAARNLQARIKPPCKVTIRGQSIGISDITGRVTSKAASLALQFEADEFRAKVAEKIGKIRRGENLIAFPAVLGLSDAQAVKSDMEARLGVRVVELPVLPPSVPGMRAFDAFQNRLRAAGVRVILGFEVVSTISKAGRCEAVILKTPAGERIHKADAFVLATGRFLGGGLRTENNRIVEPLFKLPVAQPETKDDWFHDEFLGGRGHPINRAGVRTNNRLNPVDADERTLLENVYVAGSILGHYDPTREKSGGGVDIATGHKVVSNLLRSYEEKKHRS